MKLKFSYSKIKEKEKLLSIFDGYQWHIDNNFPIILPKFYVGIYQQYKNNKKDFGKEVDKEFNKIYNKNDYQINLDKVQRNWEKIEPKFLSVLNDFRFKRRDTYICYISLYGPEGQFEYPNIINLRANNSKDIQEANQTIAHELIHLLIYSRVKKLKLNYKQTEGVVDLFLTETKLKTIFPKYGLQSIAIHNKQLFQKIKENS